MTETSVTRALLESIIHCPLLIEKLPEASAFPREHLSIPNEFPDLNPAQKLGHLYEDALTILLKNSRAHTLVEKSLQIQKDIHTTVGEVDFLLRNNDSSQLIHLELATKFYLGVETPTGILLPGPDARDNYERKLSRMREHQLQLGHRYHNFLPAEYRKENLEVFHLIFGCIFDHIAAASTISPQFISPNCRRGKWLHLSEIGEHFPGSTTFQVIPKRLWPVPLALLDKFQFDEWTPAPHSHHCVMIRVPGDETSYFIAPDGYPNHGGGIR